MHNACQLVWPTFPTHAESRSQQSGPAGQSEHTGLYLMWRLKETEAKTKCFRQRLKRGAAATGILREVMDFLNTRAFSSHGRS